MKAFFNSMGALVLAPEDNTEKYALGKWVNENTSGNSCGHGVFLAVGKILSEEELKVEKGETSCS